MRMETERDRCLVAAVSRGDGAAVARLLADGADPMSTFASTQGRMPVLANAIYSGHLEITRSLLAAGSPVDQMIGESCERPLHLATWFREPAMAELILSYGAKIDAVDILGSTALHDAVERGHELLVEYLLAAGADPTVRARDGDMPLAFAFAPSCWWSMAAALLAHGAPLDPDIEAAAIAQGDDREAFVRRAKSARGLQALRREWMYNIRLPRAGSVHERLALMRAYAAAHPDEPPLSERDAF